MLLLNIGQRSCPALVFVASPKKKMLSSQTTKCGIISWKVKSIASSISKKMKVYQITVQSKLRKDHARYVKVLPICVSLMKPFKIHNCLFFIGYVIRLTCYKWMITLRIQSAYITCCFVGQAFTLSRKPLF